MNKQSWLLIVIVIVSACFFVFWPLHTFLVSASVLVVAFVIMKSKK